MIPDSVFAEIASGIMKIHYWNYPENGKQKLIDYLKEKLTPFFEFNSALSETWNNEEDEVWNEFLE
jgi:hypothetical protein